MKTPPDPPFRVNVDRHGMPLDYATYVWLLYGRVVEDRSPQRIALLHGGLSPQWRPPLIASRDTR